jgi:hypothetical protein
MSVVPPDIASSSFRKTFPIVVAAPLGTKR